MPVDPDQSSTYCPEEMSIKNCSTHLWSLYLKTCQRSWSPSYIVNKYDLDILHMCQNRRRRSALLLLAPVASAARLGCLPPGCLPLRLSFPLDVSASHATKVSLDPACSFSLLSHLHNPGKRFVWSSQASQDRLRGAFSIFSQSAVKQSLSGTFKMKEK